MGLDGWDERMNGHESEPPRSPEVEGRSPSQDDFSSFYETVLNLSNAMGRVEERSKAQGEKLTEVAKGLEKTSRDIYGAKIGLWVVGSIIIFTALRILLSSQ